MNFVNINVLFVDSKNRKLKRINDFILATTILLFIVFGIGFLPLHDTTIAYGYYYEPIFSIFDDWAIIAVFVFTFIICMLINTVNKVTRKATFDINQDEILITEKVKQHNFNMEEIDYLELSEDSFIYMRTKNKQFFNFTILTKNKIRDLNTLLYQLKNKTKVKIRD